MLLRHRIRPIVLVALTVVAVVLLVQFEDVIATMALLTAVVAFQAVEAVVSYSVADFTFGPMDAFALILSGVITGGMMLAEKRGWFASSRE